MGTGRVTHLSVRGLALFVLAAMLTPSSLAGEPMERPVLIGSLASSFGFSGTTLGLRDGLEELGYRENEQYVLGMRFTQGDPSLLPAAARDLIENGVDILYVEGDNALRAAQLATREIPIVFAGVSNPVKSGLVQSFARPGGNVTGVSGLSAELAAKRLELFRELLPGLKRVLFPYDRADLHAVAEAEYYRVAARQLGIILEEQPLGTQDEAREALARIRKGAVDGILATYLVPLNIPGFILEAESREGIPAMYAAGFWPDRSGFASYAPDYYSSGRQAARLVDKIIRGANPGEIPVEVNMDFELVINLKTAKALGIEIPPEALYQADRIIR